MRAWIESATGLWLLDPHWLWLLALVLVALLYQRRTRSSAVVFAPLAIYGARGAPRTARNRLRWVPLACEVLGLALAILALARPAERVRVPREQQGLEILLCFDRSSSMLADDLDARRTRREVATESAARFVAARPDDRIGLLAFARYADLVCPPTLDHGALLAALRALEPVAADGPEDATGIGAAVALAASRLSEVPQATRGERPSRVIILFTDGEENVALAGTPEEISPLEAAQLCEKDGIKVYAIAAGRGRRGADGAWIDLDTRALDELASRSGGRKFRARNAGDVEQVFHAIDRLERFELSAPEWRAEDRFAPFLFAAILALALARTWHLGFARKLP